MAPVRGAGGRFSRGREACWALRASILIVAVLALIAVPATAAARPVYGVVPQDGGLPTGKDLKRMAEGGVTSIRLVMHWPSIEPEPGQYRWASTDGVMRQAVRHRIQPFFFLSGTPEWAARQDGHSCTFTGCWNFAPSSPATRTAYAQFAASAVARYGPNGAFWVENPAVPRSPIRTWQIWNEQNSPKYFAPQVDVAQYAAMLGAAGDAIHGVDPGASVVLGGMWGPTSASDVVTPVTTYLRQLYAIAGARDYFDAIAIHPYSSSVQRSVGQIKGAREVLKQEGDAQIGTWITEIGWSSAGPQGNPYVKGRKGQASTLSSALNAYANNRRSFKLRGVFWYSWRDKRGGNAVCKWCAHAGLRARDGSAKPAWKAFAAVARR